MKKTVSVLIVFTISWSAKGQKLMPYSDWEGITGNQLHFNVTIRSKDSSYQLYVEWETAPDSMWWYRDSGKFTFNGKYLKLFSSKPEQKEEDRYFVEDELKITNICEDTVWGFKAKTTGNIRYGKNKVVLIGEQPPSAWYKWKARLRGQYRRTNGKKDRC